MDNQFPQMLFKAGGLEQMHGGFFTTLIVNDQPELDAALADGWAETTPGALEVQQAEKDRAAKAAAEAAAKLADQASIGDGDKPTRPELEQKATELGITFKPTTSDKRLAEAINAKLADQAAEAAAAAGT